MNEPEDFMRIGEYQLRNLISNRTQFVYLDLRSPERIAAQAPGHFFFTGSIPARSEQVLEIMRDKGYGTSTPVVLICENGSKTVAVAKTLAQNSFLNVFVVEGGADSLPLD